MTSLLSRATGPYWDALVVRLIAAAPLIGVGLAHVFKPGNLYGQFWLRYSSSMLEIGANCRS